MEEKKMNEKKPMGKFATVLFSLLVALVFFGVQFVIGYIGVIPTIMESMTEAAGDMNAYSEIYMDKITNSGIMTTIQCLASVASLIVIAIWYYFGYVRNKLRANHYEILKKQTLNKNSIIMILAGTVAIYALATFIEGIVNVVNPSAVESFSQTMEITFSGSSILVYLITVFLAPISEELCVRGIIVSQSKKAFGLAGTMIISALIFGLLHGNIVQGLYALPMGLFWGFLAYKYESVLPTIVCHFLNNLIAMVISNFISENNQNAVFVIFAVLLVVCGGLAIYFGRKVDFSEGKEEKIETELNMDTIVGQF